MIIRITSKTLIILLLLFIINTSFISTYFHKKNSNKYLSRMNCLKNGVLTDCIVIACPNFASGLYCNDRLHPFPCSDQSKGLHASPLGALFPFWMIQGRHLIPMLCYHGYAFAVNRRFLRYLTKMEERHANLTISYLLTKTYFAREPLMP